MDNVTALDKLVRSLSFEVQAVPQDNIIQVTTTSKSAPLNVKIKVRKKDEAGLHHGVITLPPNISHPHSSPEKIRLVNSDQTIMSFNMIMEADFGKPKKKSRKNILGIFKPSCLGSQSDEDENEGEINEESITQSVGALKKTILKKNRDERTRDFFGKCKPGGCLDPPFGEDREPYTPANEDEHALDDKVVLNAPMQSTENKPRSSSIFSNKILNWKRKRSTDEALDKSDEAKKEGDTKSESVLNLYHSGSLRTSATYSNSIMTYPHTVNSSELRIEENKLRVSEIYIDTSKNSFNEHSGPFFVPGIVPGIAPKKIRTAEENDAEKITSKDGKPIQQDYQRPQGFGNDGVEKPPLLSKDLATDIIEPSANLRTDISRETDAAPKTNIENRKIIPVITPLQKPGATEQPFISSVKDNGETKETEVLVTSSDNNLDPGFKSMKLIAEQTDDKSNIEALLPFDAKQNIDDGCNNTQSKIVLINKKRFAEVQEADKCTDRQQISNDGIEHILAPQQFDISEKNTLESTKTEAFNNDVDLKNVFAKESPKKTDNQIMTQSLDNAVIRDIFGLDDQSANISNNIDFTETSELDFDNNSENTKVKPEIKQKPEELLNLDNHSSKGKDILIPNKVSSELDFESLNENTEKFHKENEDKPVIKPEDKSIITISSNRQSSAYDLTDPDNHISTTVNDDSGIPTPIIRDTPLELEVDGLQQLWKNDAVSLESVPVTLNVKKITHDESIDKLDKVNQNIDKKTSSIFENRVNDTDALKDKTSDNYDETINFPGQENIENIGQYDSNSIKDDLYPTKKTNILEVTQSDRVNIDIVSKTLDEELFEITKVQQYDSKTTVGEDMINEVPVYEENIDKDLQKFEENYVHQNSGDGTPTDPTKSDEKHIKFIDLIVTEQNCKDTVVSPTVQDQLDDSKRVLLENDLVSENKQTFSESDPYLSPTGRKQNKDFVTTAYNEKLDDTIDGLEIKYPYLSVSGVQSPETDIAKYFKIDLAIQSYNDNNKVIVKSFDSNTVPQRYPNDIVKVVKCDLEIGNEILVPIGPENDLVVEIKTNKPRTNIIREVGRLNTGMTEKASLGTEIQISPANRNLIIADDIRKMLLAVYEEELLPLRKSISELKSNMEAVATQQVALKRRNMFMKRPRPSKIVPPLFKKCGCIRR